MNRDDLRALCAYLRDLVRTPLNMPDDVRRAYVRLDMRLANLSTPKAPAGDPFWLVWCPDGSKSPSHRHATLHAAQQEAERLARTVPGKQFYVLRTISVSEKPELPPITRAYSADDEIPF